MNSKFFRALKLCIFLSLSFLLIAGLYLSLSEDYASEGIEFITKTPPRNDLYKKYVYVSGEVSYPGVYSFEGNKRVNDIIFEAGGFTDNADSNFIAKKLNLSKILEDQEMIFIPSKSDAEESSAQIVSTDGKININTASQSELETLSGIGQTTAEKIISGRPYSNTSDLQDIPGIGDSKFNLIKDLVTI